MGCCISVNLQLKVRFSIDQKHSNTILEWPNKHGMLPLDQKCGFPLTKSTQIPYWNGPTNMGCCISVNLRLKVRFSIDQKHSNTILEWPNKHGMEWPKIQLEWHGMLH